MYPVMQMMHEEGADADALSSSSCVCGSPLHQESAAAVVASHADQHLTYASIAHPHHQLPMNLHHHPSHQHHQVNNQLHSHHHPQQQQQRVTVIEESSLSSSSPTQQPALHPHLACHSSLASSSSASSSPAHHRQQQLLLPCHEVTRTGGGGQVIYADLAPEFGSSLQESTLMMLDDDGLDACTRGVLLMMGSTDAKVSASVCLRLEFLSLRSSALI